MVEVALILVGHERSKIVVVVVRVALVVVGEDELVVQLDLREADACRAGTFRHLARRMDVKSSVGDPIRRLLAATPEGVGALESSAEHPEWTVACGLCAVEVEA